LAVDGDQVEQDPLVSPNEEFDPDAIEPNGHRELSLAGSKLPESLAPGRELLGFDPCGID
jgi:hypothetical protein